jgi:acetamidase/formamidase
MKLDETVFLLIQQLKHNLRRVSIGLGLLLTLLNSPALPAQQNSTIQTDHFLPSQPQNLSWGWFPLNKEPVLTVQSGETVSIDTLTHEGGTQNQEPMEFLSELGVPRDEMLQDMLDFWSSRESRERKGRSGHIITGPIYIEGAEPGDMLEIQILDVQPRVPWGVNNTGPQSGVFSKRYPGYREDDETLDISREKHLIRTEQINGRSVAVLAPNIHVPLAPFMGIMAVAPMPVIGQPGVTVAGVQSSTPPGPFGGNLDVKDLKAGTTLYLPVFHTGALFYAGDPHGAQGDGEVSGTAIEQSMNGAFRFIVHKAKTITNPRAETDTHYLLMGIDLDLDRAMRQAVWEVVDFLVSEKGLSPAKALSLSSIAVDFRVGEVVDLTQVVVGYIPKEIFLE